MTGGKYVSPTWNDNAPPELDAIELQAMSNAIALQAVVNGGTGATTPEEARANLGAATALPSIICPFAVANWTKNATDGSFYQTVACAGIRTSDGKKAFVSPICGTDKAAQALTDAAEALVKRYSCDSDGQLTARCDESAPTVAFSVSVDIVRG